MQSLITHNYHLQHTQLILHVKKPTHLLQKAAVSKRPLWLTLLESSLQPPSIP